MICAGWRQIKWAKKSHNKRERSCGVCVILMRGKSRLILVQKQKELRSGTINSTTILPIASLRFLSRKMTHLSDWIIHHLGGRFEINPFVVPIPRNPALLGQETSFTWRPGTGRYTKHSAHSGSYDTSSDPLYNKL